MKVVIDARFYGIAHTGVGRYVENLILNLPEPVTLIVSPENYSNPDLKKFPKIISYTHPYSPLSQIEIPYLLYIYHCDLLHVPFSSIPVFWFGDIVVTFHDLIKHVSKGVATTTQNPLFYWIKYCGYLLVDLIAIYKAKAIIVPTKYWQEIIKNKYHKTNVYITYEAVEDQFISTKITPVKNLSTPFIVHTGNLYPHKNLDVVFQAMKKLPLNLYLICSRSVFAKRAEDQINKMGLQKKVFFLGRLSDSEVKYVYSKALALIFPSKVEGFGLNGLEAMSVGLPVISSNASCLPEIYGNAAIYFDPDSPTNLINQINLLPKKRQELIKLGKDQVKKYSWSKMAKETWAIYQNA